MIKGINSIRFALVAALALGVIGSAVAFNGHTPVEATSAEFVGFVAKGSATASAGAPSQPSKPKKAPVASVQPAPNCKRGSYSTPAQPAVSADQPGLHQNVITPARYAVYGNNSDDINNQIAACTPVTESDGDSFAASTDYAIAWAFNYQGGSDGLCRITQVSVGVNIATIYPAWQQTAGASGTTAANWQRFLTNLTTHENGHVQLDLNAAQQILSDLQNYPPTDCANIVPAANGKANLGLALLNQANDSYDAATNHGATQGATLN